MQYQITAIRKPDRNSRVEHITHVLAPTYSPFPITVETAISIIMQGHGMFVQNGLYRAAVEVVRRNPLQALGSYYLRTQADSTKLDNLLLLPPC